MRKNKQQERNKSGDYIPKENRILAQQLAQKTYDERVLQLEEKRFSQIKKIVKDYTDGISEKYDGKEFQEDIPIILTEKGEQVRSKSEKIMADYFYRKGIEYKYECPLYLKGMGIVYPDFIFLSRKTGQEIYWEHNGKCDDPVYARNMVKKINAYENN